MKRISLSLAVVFLLLGAANSFAICTTPTGPFYTGPHGWYDYTQARSCYTLSNASTSTVGCSGLQGWTFAPGWSSSATTSFTLTATEPIFDQTRWSAETFIEFNSPDATWFDQVELDAIVTHNGVQTPYTLFLWNGTMGNLNGCGSHYGWFTATTGDTVQIVVKATNLGTNTVIKASTPRIFNQTNP